MLKSVRDNFRGEINFRVAVLKYGIWQFSAGFTPRLSSTQTNSLTRLLTPERKMRQLLSIFSHSKAARSICVSEPVNFLERLDDELVVDIMGRMTVKQIVRLRVAGTWGKQLIEGSSFSGIWKTAFRIVFTTQYLAIPLDDNRNWYQEFMQVVEQNPNRYPPASWACKPQD